VLHGWTHWRHLANMTEPSMCGGDAVFRQMTLATCLILDCNNQCVVGGMLQRALWSHALNVSLLIVKDMRTAKAYITITSRPRRQITEKLEQPTYRPTTIRHPGTVVGL